MLNTAQMLRRNLVISTVAIFLLAGSAFAWSMTATLDGAIVAPGTVIVEMNVKKVQHGVGGVISELHVREGQQVEAGAIVARLDDTTTKANLAIVVNELTSLQARLARLQAERDSRPSPLFPDALLARRAAEPDVALTIDGEKMLFAARTRTREGQKEQLKERIKQLREEMTGLDEQRRSFDEQLTIGRKELADLGTIEGLVLRQRITGLQRENLKNEAAIGDAKAKIAQAFGKITEIELQILQLDRDLATEVAKEIREVETKIGELSERRVTADDQLRRVELRAPITGYVHQLAVHTVGGVITATEPLMLIVPTSETLVVEARISPIDIDQVRFGQEARVRFSAFNRRTTPEVSGRVFRVSADAVKDPQNGTSYYTAGIRFADAELAHLATLRLVPGMPADAYVKTGERTLAQYIVKPLLDQMQRALRED
jgi:HlyD family secretion protein